MDVSFFCLLNPDMGWENQLWMTNKSIIITQMDKEDMQQANKHTLGVFLEAAHV